MKKKNIFRLLFCTITVVLLLMGTVCACHLKEPDPPIQADSSTIEPDNPSSETNAPHETDSQPAPSGPAIPTVNRQAELANAKRANPDTVAWLYIPGAEVDDPIVQGEDNGYYLNRDELAQYSLWGCYYADCRNRFEGRDGLDTNTVIYGHSASDCDPDGLKFTKLHRYMDAGFVEENPYIYLSVEGDDLIFQVTACFVTDISFDYIDPNPDGKTLTAFFETVDRKNWLDVEGASFSEGDRVLTLSTCCREYDQSGDHRLVVMGKLLPADAAAQEFSVTLRENPEID